MQKRVHGTEAGTAHQESTSYKESAGGSTFGDTGGGKRGQTHRSGACEGVVGAQDDGPHNDAVQETDHNGSRRGGAAPGGKDGDHALDVGEVGLVRRPEHSVKAEDGNGGTRNTADCKPRQDKLFWVGVSQ